MRRIALLALLLLAGCGGDAPSSVVPADATVYVGMSAAEAERLVSGTSRADVDFERDVRPWLGERAAYFALTDDSYGLVFDAEDEEAAEAFARKVTAAGPQRASAIIDGRLVLASSREVLRAADAADGGQSLGDSTRLDVAGEDGDRPPDLLLAAEDMRRFRTGLELFEIGGRVPAHADGPLTARVWNDLTEIKGLPAEPPAPSLADLPGEARVAIASPDLSADDPPQELEASGRWPRELDLAPLLRHAGAGTIAVQGEHLRFGARIVAQVTDDAALRRAVGSLARRLPRRRYIVDLQESDGTLRLLASPRISELPHFLVTVGDRLAIETGEPLGGGAEDLGDTARYRAAERRLGGPPQSLIAGVAVRNDGRGTLRVFSPGGG